MHSRSVNVLTSKEEEYYKKRYFHYRDYEGTDGRDTPGCTILDSSLIIQTKLKKYDVKVIDCGDYKQVYFYNKKFYKSMNQPFDDLELSKKRNEKEIIRKSRGLSEIEERNIVRSKLQVQRLIKSNMHLFKTFITLTFDQNKNDIDINDIKEANKKFNIFRTYIKKIKSDFLYVCVPEFQKRGAIHYHLLSNIDYNDFTLLSQQERKIYNKKDKTWHVGRDMKGWKYGFSMVKSMSDINIVGYLSKYMTKDIDNRLFGSRRYLNSRTLRQPRESYIDLDNKHDVLLYLKNIASMREEYRNTYIDKFGNEVLFIEYSQ